MAIIPFRHTLYFSLSTCVSNELHFLGRAFRVIRGDGPHLLRGAGVFGRIFGFGIFGYQISFVRCAVSSAGAGVYMAGPELSVGGLAMDPGGGGGDRMHVRDAAGAGTRDFSVMLPISRPVLSCQLVASFCVRVLLTGARVADSQLRRSFSQ